MGIDSEQKEFVPEESIRRMLKELDGDTEKLKQVLLADKRPKDDLLWEKPVLTQLP